MNEMKFIPRYLGQHQRLLHVRCQLLVGADTIFALGCMNDSDIVKSMLHLCVLNVVLA